MSLSRTSALSRRTAAYQPALAWFAAIGGAWVFVLVMLGAFTTTIGAGMVFKSWPLSDGSLNPTGWLSELDKFAEHSHRLSAALMSLITIALAVWVWRAEARGWVRQLAVFAVGLVLAQALVGGLRVLLDEQHLNLLTPSVGRLFAMLHAVLAQIYVCTLLALALSLSRAWCEGGMTETAGRGVRRLGVLACGLLLVQLAVAAVMRHSFAWLAIPTFPAASSTGGLLPPSWNFSVAIQFTHTRIMAGLLAVALPALAAGIWRDRLAGPGLKLAAGLLVALVALQITLGAFAIWRLREPYITTAHVVVGACTLATAFGLTWWAHRASIESKAAARSDGTVPNGTTASFAHE
ncbi:MAG: COX15/CtaA family protein [Verrucomicrobiota bacterium]